MTRCGHLRLLLEPRICRTTRIWRNLWRHMATQTLIALKLQFLLTLFLKSSGMGMTTKLFIKNFLSSALIAALGKHPCQRVPLWASLLRTRSGQCHRYLSLDFFEAVRSDD